MDPELSCHEEVRRLSRVLDELEFHRASDVEYRLDGAFRVEADAQAIGATELQMRARLVQADMLLRKGHGTAASAICAEVNRWARENSAEALRARSHLVLAGIFESVGDTAASLDHALRALEHTDETTSPRAKGNYLLRLADCFANVGSIESARQRYAEALEQFNIVDDVERQVGVLNNLAYSEVDAGNLPEAREAGERLRALAVDRGIVLNPTVLETLARVHIGLGEYDRAEQSVQAALDALERYGDAEASSPADFLLTLAEIHRLQGRLGLAQRTLGHCRAICHERGLAAAEVELLQEQAELHAAAGRHDQAFLTYKDFHERAARLSSSQREAAARTRQALFETAEARQEAQRFWRQARTDELTRLPNRRFVDEELPPRLNQVASGKPLVVAIVDADHFKRINDDYSHAVGDRVIRELSTLLQSAVTAPSKPVVMMDQPVPRVVGPEEGIDPENPGAPQTAADEQATADILSFALRASAGFVARLGGEEFLVVLPGMDMAEATDLLEDLRCAVEEHDWRSLLGERTMTVSIGATAALPHDTQSVALARADRCLYAAKRAGRNRVVVDFSTPRQLTA
jgi:two-component system, cell cycle response regulator